MRSVSIQVSKSMLEGCRRLGADSDRIMRQCGLSALELANPDGRLAARQHYRLLELLRPYLEQHNQALASYDLTAFYQRFPALVSHCLNQQTARAGLETFVAYRAVIGSCDDIRVSVGSHQTRFEYLNLGASRLGSTQALPNFVMLYRILSAYVADATVSLDLIGASGDPDGVLAGIFAGHCRWDQSASTLTISNRLLDTRSECFNARLYPLQRTLLQRQFTDLPGRTTLTDSVLQLISGLLASGQGDEHLLVQVCATLNMSRWTLNRRLQEEGGSFSQLLTQARLMQARSLLSGGSSALQEIAEQIGFSSQSAFSRFFKRHAGETPQAYRLRQQ